ncbi:MAG: GspE/PulE family protein, partial [Candidatus Sumerlaeota bacterium]|nr:GspE/PulE family protein [Candidatus Sumerlaeota bacterium]
DREFRLGTKSGIENYRRDRSREDTILTWHNESFMGRLHDMDAAKVIFLIGGSEPRDIPRADIQFLTLSAVPASEIGALGRAWNWIADHKFLITGIFLVVLFVAWRGERQMRKRGFRGREIAPPPAVAAATAFAAKPEAPGKVMDALGNILQTPVFGGVSFHFRSKESFPCPRCGKQIESSPEHEKAEFIVCPHCRENITSAYDLVAYVTHLTTQIEQGVVQRHKGEDEGIVERDAVNKLLHSILTLAVRKRATDLHIEPGEEASLVRIRVDGVMQDLLEMPRLINSSFVSHIKVLCDMDITERHVPQDGKLDITLDNKSLDIRVNTVPVRFGEKATLRLLDAKAVEKNLSDLGLEGDNLDKFERSIYDPNGLIIITGPTSSGKTTTLTVALNQVNTGDKNIITIENPIEYVIRGANQMQINEPQGFTFATGLRSILRQDPDVIMVGEVRDPETAKIAVEAAMTGHLVFTTLHTNNAIGVFPRLRELGVSPTRYAWALDCIVAQRLARVICSECKQPYTPTDTELATVNLKRGGMKDIVFYRGIGCDHCAQTGYYGRVGIFEILKLNDAIRTALEAEEPLSNITELAKKKAGMSTLIREGILKTAQGITTLEEVRRVTKT